MHFEGIGEAAKAVTEFYILNKEAIPAHIVERLDGNIGMSRSPVDAVVRFTEAVYANRDSDRLPEGMAELAAACAMLSEEMGYHDFAEDGRGSLIARSLRGRSVSKAPEAKSEFAEPEPVPAPPALDEGELPAIPPGE